MTVAALLAETGSFAQRQAGRGRPRLDAMTLREHARIPSIRIAKQVFREELLLGPARGSLGEAIRRVAVRLRIARDTVKKAAQRHRARRAVERSLHRLRIEADEIERRMLGFPDDVRAAVLARGHHGRLLQMLRDHAIDGTCPGWLIEYVRR